MDYLMSMCVEPGTDDTIVFEVDSDQVPNDLVLASPQLSGAAVRASTTFAEALGKLRPSLDRAVNLLHELSPERIEVEFGLKIGGETGIVVSKGTVEANFTVRLSWVRDGYQKAPDGPSATA